MKKSFNLILKSVEKTFSDIRKNKSVYLLLLTLQVSIIILFSYMVINYNLNILEELETMNEPFETLDLENNPEESAEDFLLKTHKIKLSYDNLISNILWMFLWSISILLFLEPIIWLISKYISSKGWKKELSWKNKMKFIYNYYQKYIGIILIILVPFSLITILLITTLINIELVYFSVLTKIIFFLMVLLFYLIIICISLIENSSWKRYWGKIKKSFKKPVGTILILLLITVINYFTSYFLYYSTLVLEEFGLMALSSTLFLIVLVTSKILLINFFKISNHEKNKKID